MSVELTSIIPGGTAEWFTSKTITPRRERLLQTKMIPLNSLMVRVSVDAEADITEAEAEKMLSVNELAVAVFLKSWTLDGPIPETADAVLDLPRDLYDALTGHAAKILAEAFVDDFSVDAVEDENSPTEDLGV